MNINLNKLVLEEVALHERIVRLRIYSIAANKNTYLSPAKRDVIENQIDVMEDLAAILQERIYNFDSSPVSER